MKRDEEEPSNDYDLEQPGNDGKEETGVHCSNRLGSLLYKADGDDNPLSQVDEQTNKHEEENPKSTSEGQPGVSLFDEVLPYLKSPI